MISGLFLLFLFIYLFILFWLCSGPRACQAGTLPLKQYAQPVFALVIFHISLFCKAPALNKDPST
jgi:hypothetical protein